MDCEISGVFRLNPEETHLAALAREQRLTEGISTENPQGVDYCGLLVQLIRAYKRYKEATGVNVSRKVALGFRMILIITTVLSSVFAAFKPCDGYCEGRIACKVNKKLCMLLLTLQMVFVGTKEFSKWALEKIDPEDTTANNRSIKPNIQTK